MKPGLALLLAHLQKEHSCHMPADTRGSLVSAREVPLPLLELPTPGQRLGNKLNEWAISVMGFFNVCYPNPTKNQRCLQALLRSHQSKGKHAASGNFGCSGCHLYHRLDKPRSSGGLRTDTSGFDKQTVNFVDLCRS